MNHWRFNEVNEVKFDSLLAPYESKNAAVFLEASFGNQEILNPEEYSDFSKWETLVSDMFFTSE